MKIVEMMFGSHLYGTNTPASDMDLKSVHLPSAGEILLQRVKDVVTSNTKASPGEKNTADDVDRTSFALQRFLGLAAEGQTVAVDMLFAPPGMWLGEPSPIWLDLIDNRHRLLTRQSKSFVGYCRAQANKYGIRGSRVAAARAARQMLIDKPWGAKLETLAEHIDELCREQEHMAVMAIPTQQGGEVIHWEVCGRKMPFTSSVKSAFEILDRVVREYGHRALAAETNQGVDWKAVSHAVRIANQAVELLNTGHVTFPRPEAAYLIDIKLGRLTYAEVAGHIDRALVMVEESAAASRLPEAVDQAWIDDFVMAAHRSVVTR